MLYLTIVLFLLPLAATCSPNEVVKELSTASAGRWYPADRTALLRVLGGHLAKVSGSAPEDSLLALVAPHAGYEFSGLTAAHAYKTLLGRKPRRIVLLSPSHHLPLANRVIVPAATRYRTPLGSLPLDTTLAEALAASPLVRREDSPFLQEHGIDNQVPFLQHLVKNFILLPMLVGQLDPVANDTLATLLRPHLDEHTLVVVSSDFTHYGRAYGYIPFTLDVPASLAKLDSQAVDVLAGLDGQAFQRFLERTGATICGASPLVLLLALLPAEARLHRLHASHSGNLSGDWSVSVGYQALAFTGRWPRPEKPRGVGPGKKTEPGTRAPLTPSEQQHLLTLARKVLEAKVREGRTLDQGSVDFPVTPALLEPAGVFVTLKRRGMLRGCIGEILPRRSMLEGVLQRTVDAAVNDPRFPPVTQPELQDILIEISVLSPPRPVPSHKAIELGRHGIVLRKAGRSAIFLPQVAPEQGWNLATTLDHLAQKAGLSADAWRQGATFEVFEAFVFHERP